ncbi:MAG: glycoside hydrolase family 3 C-terminal domain-containing protein [Haliea sp.]|nr:glycoside hydrolase family 3 C-terminal domain-containing protein [Haliea sp.]
MVVLINGSPIAMPWVHDVAAILECWYPGMEGGAAIARTLFGDVNPSVNCPSRFRVHCATARRTPRRATFRERPAKGVLRRELMVGYRHFDKYGIEPLFPFGHGLSYTRFDYADLVLAQTA